MKKDDRSHGTRLTELRRSSAAGTHGKTSKDRYNAEREALNDQEDFDIVHLPMHNEDGELTGFWGLIVRPSDYSEYIEDLEEK